MAAFRFPFRLERPLEELFSEVPETVGSFLKSGFAALHKVPSERYPTLLKAARESFGSAYLMDTADIQSQFELSADEAGSLIASITFLSMALSARQETSEKLIDAATKQGLLDEAHKKAASDFCALITDRTELKLLIERSRIAEEGLPSLAEFEAIVDFRPGFDGDRIKFGVPVLLVHIDTDAPGQEIWFQISKVEAEKLVRDLEKKVSQLAEVEGLFDAVLKGSRK